jgi:Na+/H+ antiporter NhaD/arsenite permease-like protein
MLSGLAVLWLLTDALHYGEDKEYPRVPDALKNIDIGGVMFFFGILMAVEALNTAGILHNLAQTLNEAVPNVDIIAAAIGLVSAIIDNVPLVEATMGMYDLSQVPVDSQLWQLVALCAGTGGSLLVVGSAAGVAFMGMEGVGFSWYAKRISPWVFAGYAASLAVYVAAHGLPGSGLA